jgi:hypothetical protein
MGKYKENSRNFQKSDSDGCYDTYADYARTLRSWFVGFGIFGPVLLISKNELISKVLTSPFANFIIGGFFVGIVCQIFLALISP